MNYFKKNPEEIQKNNEGTKNSRYKTEILNIGRNLLTNLGFIKRIDQNDIEEPLRPKELTLVSNYMLEDQDLILKIGKQRICIRKNGEDFEIILYINNKKEVYKCEKEKKYIIGREGDIKIDKNNKTASRKHLELKITNDGNILLKDISKNGTQYRFAYRDGYDNPFL